MQVVYSTSSLLGSGYSKEKQAAKLTQEKLGWLPALIEVYGAAKAAKLMGLSYSYTCTFVTRAGTKNTKTKPTTALELSAQYLFENPEPLCSPPRKQFKRSVAVLPVNLSLMSETFGKSQTAGQLGISYQGLNHMLKVGACLKYYEIAALQWLKTQKNTKTDDRKQLNLSETKSAWRGWTCVKEARPPENMYVLCLHRTKHISIMQWSEYSPFEPGFRKGYDDSVIWDVVGWRLLPEPDENLCL